MCLDAVAQTFNTQIRTGKDDRPLNEVERTDTALVHDGSEHVLDELRRLGNLVEHDEHRLGTIDAMLVGLAHTEALVRQLTRDAVLTIKVRHPHRAVRQLRAVDGVNSDMVGELGHALERVEQRSLTDTVLALDDDGALVADRCDEVGNLGERQILIHGELLVIKERLVGLKKRTSHGDVQGFAVCRNEVIVVDNAPQRRHRGNWVLASEVTIG